jgi:hypothetical protein
MNTVNPVQFYPRNQGFNLDPGSTNSSRIAPQNTEYIEFSLNSPSYVQSTTEVLFVKNL